MSQLLASLALLVLPPSSSLCLGQEADQEPSKPKEPGRRVSIVDLPEDYVRLVRVPDQGVQPCLSRDGAGVALLYAKSEGERLDLHLTRSKDDGQTFATGLKLNSSTGVLQAGNRHSGSIALGPDGRANVAWISAGEVPTLCYVRETVEGGLGDILDLGSPPGLTGTTSIAVDQNGQVYLFYFSGVPYGHPVNLGGLRLWTRRSADGLSFSEPVAIDRGRDGISGNSAMAALYMKSSAQVLVLSRAACAKMPGLTEVGFRGMQLVSTGDGVEFDHRLVDSWLQQNDPGSDAELFQGEDVRVAIWDARGSLFWSAIGGRNRVFQPLEIKDPSGRRRLEHPAGATDDMEILLTWLEELPDKSEPARLAWRVILISSSQIQGQARVLPDGPKANAPVAFARRDRGFTIVY